VITTAELRKCGFNASAIATRQRIGWLHPLHRAVYAFGHPNPPWEGQVLAAVKALGPGALLSHYTACELWGFVDRLERIPDVTVVAAGSRPHHKIRVHRTSHLDPLDRRERSGIPVVAPARAILDLATMVDARRVRAALRRAQGLGRLTLSQLGLALDRYRRRRGNQVVREAVALGAAPTRSERESDVLDLVLAGGFARPDVNKALKSDGRIVIPDFRWPAAKLTLEIDSDAWHADPLARADDRERQALLETHGDTVMRVHWRDAVLGPAELHATLRAAGAPLGEGRVVRAPPQESDARGRRKAG
jgi:hypothetical protein